MHVGGGRIGKPFFSRIWGVNGTEQLPTARWGWKRYAAVSFWGQEERKKSEQICKQNSWKRQLEEDSSHLSSQQAAWSKRKEKIVSENTV